MSTELGTPTIAAPPQPKDANLCWLLTRASHALMTKLTAALEELGVSPRGHHVLFEAMQGTYTQTELARMIGIDKTTMVVTVDELEALGLAERRATTRDRRARVIAVTEAGERKVREGQEIAERIQAEILDTLPENDRQVFLAALMQLVSEPLAERVPTAHAVRQRVPR
jgi:MarR family transcriptional regulator, transcriptional regulator for hemolysin